MSETLNVSQLKKVTAWLTDRGVLTRPCSACGESSERTIDSKLAGLSSSVQKGEWQVGQAQVPVVVVQCDHCAHVQTFSARTIGVGSSGFKF